jgi:uncharacterized protein YdaU (DUF1376 family)
MRLFVGDYLGDTRHLTTLEHGAYLLLIMGYWQRGGALPADDRKLAHIAGLTRYQWAKISPTILEFFVKKNDVFLHKRLEKELADRGAKSLKSKEAGLASAQHRLNGRSTMPLPLPVEERDKSLNVREDAHECELPLDEPPDGGDPPEETYTVAFELWWHDYPNKTGKRKAASEYQLAFKRLGGAKAGTEKIHLLLRAALNAQVAVWKRKGVVGRFIPHPATWLHQSRWTDAEVQKQLSRPTVTTPPGGPVSLDLTPAEPPPDKPARIKGRVGWTPDDEKVS